MPRVLFHTNTRFHIRTQKVVLQYNNEEQQQNEAREREDEHQQNKQTSSEKNNMYEVIFGSISFGWHLANGKKEKKECEMNENVLVGL